jgi:hypothetical protein
MLLFEEFFILVIGEFTTKIEISKEIELPCGVYPLCPPLFDAMKGNDKGL